MRQSRWIAGLCAGTIVVAVTFTGCRHDAPVKHHAAKKAAPENEELRERVEAMQAQMDMLKQQTAALSPPPQPETDPVAKPSQFPPPPPPPPLPVTAIPDEAGASQPPTSRQINQWYNGLSNGLVEYAVPSTMYVGDDVTVSVRIHGTQSTTPTLGGRSGSAMVKVSTQMQAQLGQSANPGEFTITPAGPVQKTIVDAGDNTWTWTVRPLKFRHAAQLDIQLWVLYPGQEASSQVPVISTTIPVVVAVPPLRTIVSEVVPQDPPTIAQQLLPKGFWAEVGALVLWLVHFLKKKYDQKTGVPVERTNISDPKG